MALRDLVDNLIDNTITMGVLGHLDSFRGCVQDRLVPSAPVRPATSAQEFT
jgi:hypothetical protein